MGSMSRRRRISSSRRKTLFERWLRAHKEWWGNNVRNVPQQIGAALKDESFYTQAVSSGAAVVNFNSLPIARPAGATFVHGMLAGRTQSDIPNAADTVFVSAIANGKPHAARQFHADHSALQEEQRVGGLACADDALTGLITARGR